MMYLITGGAGFIGSNIAENLVAKGEKVRVLDNLSTGRMANLEKVIDSIEFFEGDINDPESLEKCLTGVSFVLHQAAVPSVQRSIKDPLACNHSIVDGTLCLLVKAREAGVRRIVLASSSSVYGDNPVLPQREDGMPAPISPYAAAKYTCEAYARIFARLYDLETVSLRYFNVFGPGQDPLSEYAAVIPEFITRMLTGVPPVIFGDGEQSRDFTFVENVIQANLRACHSPRVGKGETINIACGKQYSLNRLAKMLNYILETDFKPQHEPPRPGEIKHSLADITRAERLLDYNVEVDIAEGLSTTADYYKGLLYRQNKM